MKKNQRDRLMNTQLAPNGARVVWVEPKRNGEPEPTADELAYVEAHPEEIGEFAKKLLDAL